MGPMVSDAGLNLNLLASNPEASDSDPPAVLTENIPNAPEANNMTLTVPPVVIDNGLHDMKGLTGNPMYINEGVINSQIVSQVSADDHTTVTNKKNTAYPVNESKELNEDNGSNIDVLESIRKNRVAGLISGVEANRIESNSTQHLLRQVIVEDLQ